MNRLALVALSTVSPAIVLGAATGAPAPVDSGSGLGLDSIAYITAPATEQRAEMAESLAAGSPTPVTESQPVAAATGQCHSVCGQVTDAVTGLPLPGITVVVAYTSIHAKTDVQGHYALDLPPGSWEIYTAADFYQATDSAKANVDAGSPGIELDLRMSAAPSPASPSGTDRDIRHPMYRLEAGPTGLDLTVVDAQTGEGIPGMAAIALYAGIGGRPTPVTDAEGHLTDNYLPPGTYKIGLMPQDTNSPAAGYALANINREYLFPVADGYTTVARIELGR